MQKIIACILSFLMVYTSIAPSYAQAVEGVARQRFGVEALPTDGVNRALDQAQLDYYKQQASYGVQASRQVAAVAQEVAGVVEMLGGQQAQVADKSNYAYFKEVYAEQLGKAYREGKADLEQAKKGLKAEYKDLLLEDIVVQACEAEEDVTGCEAAYKEEAKRIYEEGLRGFELAQVGLERWYNEQSKEESILAAYEEEKVNFDKQLEQFKAIAAAEALEAGRKY